jgi:hypothetical protein
MFRCGGRAVPGRSRPAPRLALAWRVFAPVGPGRSPLVGGWVGFNTEPWGCVGGRPRPGGTPVVDETVPAGCLRDYPVVPSPTPPWPLGDRLCVPRNAAGLVDSLEIDVTAAMGRTTVRSTPVPVDNSLAGFPMPRCSERGCKGTRCTTATAQGEGRGSDRDHRIVAWAPGSDGLVDNGRAPMSGTAASATPGFGSDPKPTTTPTSGAPSTHVPARATRAGVERIPTRGERARPRETNRSGRRPRPVKFPP